MNLVASFVLNPASVFSNVVYDIHLLCVLIVSADELRFRPLQHFSERGTEGRDETDVIELPGYEDFEL
jgi:hypothetical protein